MYLSCPIFISEIFRTSNRRQQLVKIFVAERLWSDKSVRSTYQALPRLNEWRCQMTARGLPAEPNLSNINREGYHQYGYCPEPYDPFNINFFWWTYNSTFTKKFSQGDANFVARKQNYKLCMNFVVKIEDFCIYLYSSFFLLKFDFSSLFWLCSSILQKLFETRWPGVIFIKLEAKVVGKFPFFVSKSMFERIMKMFWTLKI